MKPTVGPIQFRKATESDIDSLVNMRMALLAEVAETSPTDSKLREALTRYFSETLPDGQFSAYLADVDGDVVGVSGLVYQRNPPSARSPNGIEAYVMNMYTRPEWRGRGIAARLLNQLIELARLKGCWRVRLHAVSQAVPIYVRANFIATQNEMQLDMSSNNKDRVEPAGSPLKDVKWRRVLDCSFDPSHRTRHQLQRHLLVATSEWRTKASRQSGGKSKPWIEVRMAKNNNDLEVGPAAEFQSCLDESRPNPSVLELGNDRHWSE